MSDWPKVSDTQLVNFLNSAQSDTEVVAKFSWILLDWCVAQCFSGNIWNLKLRWCVQDLLLACALALSAASHMAKRKNPMDKHMYLCKQPLTHCHESSVKSWPVEIGWWIADVAVIHQQFSRQHKGWKLTKALQRPSVNRYFYGKHCVVQLIPSSRAKVPVLQIALGCCLAVAVIVDRGSRVPCPWKKL